MAYLITTDTKCRFIRRFMINLNYPGNNVQIQITSGGKII
jgi:hypothetical protein